jgi:hypothetical protein
METFGPLLAGAVGLVLGFLLGVFGSYAALRRRVYNLARARAEFTASGLVARAYGAGTRRYIFTPESVWAAVTATSDAVEADVERRRRQAIKDGEAGLAPRRDRAGAMRSSLDPAKMQRRPDREAGPDDLP